MPQDLQRGLSPAEAAARKGVSTKTIRRLIADGTLPAKRLGPRLIKIDVEDVDALGEDVVPETKTAAEIIRAEALRVVSEAPKLTPEQLDQICALLRGVA